MSTPRNRETRVAMQKRPQVPVRWRLLASAVLLFHLTAVFFPPFTFATAWTGMASPFAEPIMRALRPYVSFLFLDHGYFFFAPNPGPSHLLRARLEFADGREPVMLTFPDRNEQWPRLLYHRHFMLAEQFHSDFATPEPPPMVSQDPEQFAAWRHARSVYEMRRKAIEDHLLHKHGASSVSLARIEHTLQGPSEFRDLRKPLNADDGYRELPETGPDFPTLAPSIIP